jgi:type III secretion protein C
MRDESLLIGGYNSVQTISGVDKVPLLGDLPLIGALFSNTSTQVQRRERLFLIRPTVLDDSARVGPAEAAAPAAPLPPTATPATPAQAPRQPAASSAGPSSAPVSAPARNVSPPPQPSSRQGSPARPGN